MDRWIAALIVQSRLSTAARPKAAKTRAIIRIHGVTSSGYPTVSAQLIAALYAVRVGSDLEIGAWTQCPAPLDALGRSVKASASYSPGDGRSDLSSIVPTARSPTARSPAAAALSLTPRFSTELIEGHLRRWPTFARPQRSHAQHRLPTDAARL